MPRISVLMTTYNGAATIADSISSILSQSWRDFELIVVDDGSNDATQGIVSAVRDPRLRLIHLPRNGGIVAARNTAFAAATGEFIAALDHDDLSHPERLARQVDYLDAHHDVVALGTEVSLDVHGRHVAPDHLIAGDALAIRWLLHIDNPLTWSSIMLRAEAIARLGAFMRPEYELADDFDLYHRLLAIGDIARLPDVLTTYRFHGANASYDGAARLDANAARVLEVAYADALGRDAGTMAALAVRHWLNRRPVRDAATLEALGDVLERLLAAFCAVYAMREADRKRIGALAAETWWRTVRGAVRSGSPWLQRRRRARQSLCLGFVPSASDRLISAAIGAIRAIRRRPA